MKALIYIVCFVVYGAINTYLNTYVLKLGAIPTVVLYVLAYLTAKFLCKVYDNRNHKEKNALEQWKVLEERCYTIIKETCYVPLELLKPFIIDKINYNIKHAPNDIFEFNIERTALMMIYNITVNSFIITGRFHLATGVLDLQGMQLLKLAKHTLNEALNKGYINDSEYNECINALYDNISHIG